MALRSVLVEHMVVKLIDTVVPQLIRITQDQSEQMFNMSITIMLKQQQQQRNNATRTDVVRRQCVEHDIDTIKGISESEKKTTKKMVAMSSDILKSNRVKEV